MRFKPTYNNILVKPRESDKKVGKLGIIEVAPNAVETNIYGDVIAVGSGLYTESGVLISLTVKANDVIFFPRAAGSEIRIDGELFLLVKENDVIGIVD